MRLTWPNLKHFHTNVLYRPVAGVLTTIHVFYSTLCRLLQSLLYISVVLLSGHLWYTEFPPCARNSLCFTSSCWNQHLGALCAGLMKSFMLWLNQMIRGWADGASKRNPCPQERRIKQVCDSVITDRTATDYRPSEALSSYWCRSRHKDSIHINMLEVRANIACTILYPLCES